MDGYFKPWRRKLGVVTLVLACMVLGTWLRGRERTDTFVIQYGNSTFGTRFGGSIHCFVARTKEPNPFHIKLSPMLNSYVQVPGFGYESQEIQANVRFGEFAYSSGRVYETKESWSWLIFPHWCIFLPATLLSAWLLLSKPPTRQNADPNATNSAPRST